MTAPPFKWTAREIARSLYLQAFNMKHLVLLPNCYFPGSECDLLVVRNDLRMMEVEIKISRSDLKADATKDKWFDRPTRWDYGRERPAGVPLTHPKRIWKHYYCMPHELWKDDLAGYIQPTSGVILMREFGAKPYCHIHRQAKAAKVCDKIDLADLCQLARIATDRMWRAFDEVDSFRRQQELDAAKKRDREQSAIA